MPEAAGSEFWKNLTPIENSQKPDAPREADAVRAGGAVLGVLRMLADERSGGRPAPAAHRSRLIVAEDYVERHLHDASLAPGEVARVHRRRRAPLGLLQPGALRAAFPRPLRDHAVRGPRRPLTPRARARPADRPHPAAPGRVSLRAARRA